MGSSVPHRVPPRARDGRTLGLDPADRATLRSLLAKHSVVAKRSRGQHFLASPAVLDAIVDAAALGPDERVVEIGPGLGALTVRLAARAGEVVAYEVDSELAAILTGEVLPGHPNVRVVRADALAVDLLATHPTRVVANLPYQIATPILERILADERRPAIAVVMVQQEVAERITGAARSWLSVFAASFARAEILRRVSPGAFTPPPRVASAVVRLVARERPLFAPYPQAPFLALVSDAFRHRRKTLVSALGFEAGLARGDALAIVAEAHLPPTTRPESLSPEQWVALYGALASRGARPS